MTDQPCWDRGDQLTRAEESTAPPPPADDAQPEPTPVRALRTGGRGGYLLVRAREWERDRFWVLPSLVVLAGVGLAVLTAEAERLGIPTSWPSGLRVDPSAAGDILGVVAT